jgi:hypothetical protein
VVCVFNRSGLDPIDSQIGVRPIELQVLSASSDGITKVKLSIPEPEGRNSPYLLWVTTSGNPPQLWLTTNAYMDSNEWTSEWFMDNTTQPDGTESVPRPLPRPHNATFQPPAGIYCLLIFISSLANPQVRFYTYSCGFVRPFNLAVSQTGGVRLAEATSYFKMIGTDAAPIR